MPTPTRSEARRGLLLSPALFGCVARYVDMAAHGENVACCYADRFDKRLKSAHRFTIADVNGPLDLTVPIVKGGSTWANTHISLHNQWWSATLTALESAYGRTPFFEFYIDRFLPFFSSSTPADFESVAEMCRQSERIVCRILEMPEPKNVSVEDVSALSDYDDRRGDRYPKISDYQPYWQVRDSYLGFLPNLSVLDLIFSMGPESAAVIERNLDMLANTDG